MFLRTIRHHREKFSKNKIVARYASNSQAKKKAYVTNTVITSRLQLVTERSPKKESVKKYKRALFFALHPN